MTYRSIATILAAATAFAAASTAPLRADDAGSVRNQAPGSYARQDERRGETVTRGPGLFGFGPLITGVEGPDAAETARRLRGDFPDGM